MSEAFRFLQVGDLHLEQPLQGVAEVPDDWRHLFVDAPLQAARKVFETAVKEQVDFVLLTGDSLDPPRAGPRAISFLLDQFQLLHERGIAVYWVGGTVDRAEEWPAGLRFPESVQLYPNNRVIEITHMKGDQPIASIYGQSRSTRSEIRLSDFDHDDAQMFSIALCHGFLEASSLHRLRMDYWALGGEHERRTLAGLAATAHYAGSTQGRSPDEVGPHGCTLVHVDDDRRVRSRFIATDVVRWQRERIVCTPTVSLLELERVLFDRTKKLVADAEDRPQLVSFVIDGADRWTLSQAGDREPDPGEASGGIRSHQACVVSARNYGRSRRRACPRVVRGGLDPRRLPASHQRVAAGGGRVDRFGVVPGGAANRRLAGVRCSAG
jgi:DNA repair protein SbcD/Mre11